MTTSPSHDCPGAPQLESAAGPARSAAKKGWRGGASVLLGVLVAFCPKCPMCWAAYLGAFGGMWLASSPYLEWLFPVLLALLAWHLWVLFRQIPHKGPGPFAFSVAGATTSLLGRFLFPDLQWIPLAAIACFAVGALWNTFAGRAARPPVHVPPQPTIP